MLSRQHPPQAWLNRSVLVVFVLALLVVVSIASWPASAAPGSTVQIPGRIEAEDYKLGGEGVGYHDTSGGNNGGAYRTDDVDIETCNDGPAPCYDVGWINPTEWLAFDTNVPTAGNYVFTVRAATPETGGSMHIEVDGVNVSGPIAIPQTGGWQNWRDVPTKAIPLTAGAHAVRLVFDASYFNLNYVDVKTPTAVPTATATTPPTATPNIPAAQLPGRVQAEAYKAGGEGVGYHDTSIGNNGGAYRTEDVDIETCNDGPAPCYDVGWINPTEWLAFNANITTADNYIFTVRAATPETGGSMHIEVDGVNVSGPIAIPQTGGWQNWTNVQTNPIALTAGAHTLRLVFDASYFNLNYVDAVRQSEIPTPTATATPPATATPTVPRLVDVALDKTSVPAGGTVVFSYTVFSPSAQQVSLGAGLAPTGSGNWINDSANDTTVSVPAGTSVVTRQYKVPFNASTGNYDAIWGLWTAGYTSQLGQQQRAGVIAVTSALPTPTGTPATPTMTGTPGPTATTNPNTTVSPTATPSAPTLLNVDVQPRTANTGDTITLSYTIFSPAAAQFGLGAGLGPSNSPQISDPGNDRLVNVPAGTSVVTRPFYIRPDAVGGPYDIDYGLWNATFDNRYGYQQRNDILTVQVVPQTTLTPQPTPAPTTRSVPGASVFISAAGPVGGTVVNTGSNFTLNYTINNTTGAPISLRLGASLAPSGSEGFGAIQDTANQATVSVPAGTSTQTRTFKAPANASAGGYDLTWQLLDAGSGAVLDTLTAKSHIWLEAQGQVTDVGVTLVSANLSSSSVTLQQGTMNRVSSTFNLENTTGSPVRAVLRMRIKQPRDADYVYDWQNDSLVSVPAGTSSFTRAFNLPLYLASAKYDVYYEVMTPDYTAGLDSNYLGGVLTVNNPSPLPNVGVPILMYHAINPTAPGGTWIALANFTQHMDYLANNGYHTVDGEAIYNYVYKGTALPSKPVWLTFDDAYQNVYDYAFPVMQQRGFGGSVFAVTQYAGQQSLWDLCCTPPQMHMSWPMLRQMANNNNYADLHTQHHAHLDQSDYATQQKELWGSQRDLVAFTGKPGNNFAYPYGNYTDTAEWVLAHSGVRAAAIIGNAKQNTSNVRDIYELTRIGIWAGDTLQDFINKVTAP